MRVKISSILESSAEKIFFELQKPALLKKIASPLLDFKCTNGKSFPIKWVEEKLYEFNLYGFMFLYFGKHTIIIKKLRFF